MANYIHQTTKPTLTRDVFASWASCAKDPVHFIDTMVTNHPDVLSDDLNNMVTQFNQHQLVTVTHDRQAGVTTTTLAYILWLMVHQPNLCIGVTSHNHDASRWMLSRFRDLYDTLPKSHQIPMERCNASEIKLENNSRLIALSTNPRSIRGLTLNVMILDNAALSNNAAKEWLLTLSPMMASTRGKVFVLVSDGFGVLPTGMEGVQKVMVRG